MRHDAKTLQRDRECRFVGGFSQRCNSRGKAIKETERNAWTASTRRTRIERTSILAEKTVAGRRMRTIKRRAPNARRPKPQVCGLCDTATCNVRRGGSSVGREVRKLTTRGRCSKNSLGAFQLGIATRKCRGGRETG